MCTTENAEMHYNNDNTASESILVAAEQQLLHRAGVTGIGITKTSEDEEAIVVYVLNSDALAHLPAFINGWKVIGEVTGEIDTQ